MVLSRRRLLLGGLGLVGAGFLPGCKRAPAGHGAAPRSYPTPTLTPAPGRRVVTASLRPRPVTLDLGGVTARTWGYDDAGATLLRATAGDVLAVRVDNDLPASTSVHWHGIRLHHAADGVPGVTQPPIEPGHRFDYTFLAPDPGTYFFHPHSGVQLDRALYAPLIIDDPAEPGGYDDEWVVLLDDWTDGVGPDPDAILADFLAQDGPVSRGMGHGGGHGMGSPLGDAGDVPHPYHLVNGRIPDAPVTLRGRPGRRLRLRIINAAADTIYQLALGGHVLTVTHADGFPVVPRDARSLYVGMGERIDALVTLGDGAFPLVARPLGKQGTGFAVVRTAAGPSAPGAGARVPELDADALLATDLRAAESALLPRREVEDAHRVELNGQMDPYGWGLNGRKFGDHEPIDVTQGCRVRLRLTNLTMMAHPMHLHGHTWSLPGSGGLRKDTVLLLPMQSLDLDLDTDNPGEWMLHCHNLYHAEAGMMTTLRYLP